MLIIIINSVGETERYVYFRIVELNMSYKFGDQKHGSVPEVELNGCINGEGKANQAELIDQQSCVQLPANELH